MSEFTWVLEQVIWLVGAIVVGKWVWKFAFGKTECKVSCMNIYCYEPPTHWDTSLCDYHHNEWLKLKEQDGSNPSTVEKE